MRYATRMGGMGKSFVREILKVTLNKDMISFAGGLPNPSLFPVEEIARAAEKVIRGDGENVLQYSTTEGYLPLREYIADRYYPGYNVTAANIIITTGSQQALDLISKVFVDPGDPVLIERPGYLGAIQAFSMFQADIRSVELDRDGINLDELETLTRATNPKLFYAVPNFQNPTGLTYSPANRSGVAEVLAGRDTLMIEDNPYGELRFVGEPVPPMIHYLGDQVIALGSFSKVFAPSMRLGWACATEEIVDQLISVKQASDLHTDYFAQRVLYQYLLDNDLDTHVVKLREAYGAQRDHMVNMLKAQLPAGVRLTEPDGGMFIWLTLPEGMSSTALFEMAFERKVAFVPGIPFYNDIIEENTLRLNYTNSAPTEIEAGVVALARAIDSLASSSGK